MLNNLYVLPTELTRVHFRRKQLMTESNFKELLKRYKKLNRKLALFQALFFTTLALLIGAIDLIISIARGVI